MGKDLETRLHPNKKLDCVLYYIGIVGWFTPTITTWWFGYLLISNKLVIEDLDLLVNFSFAGPVVIMVLGCICHMVGGNNSTTLSALLRPGIKCGKIGALSFIWSLPAVFVLDWLIGRLLPTYSSIMDGYEHSAIIIAFIISSLFTIFILVILRGTINNSVS